MVSCFSRREVGIKRRLFLGGTVLVLMTVLGFGRGTLASASPYSQSVLSDNPVAYWRLGEADSATPAADETAEPLAGRYQNGTIVGEPGPLADDLNKCLV